MIAMNELKIGDLCHVVNCSKLSLATSGEVGIVVRIINDKHMYGIKSYWVLYTDKLRGPFFTKELSVLE